jgi:hypothetical protein
MDQLIVEKNSIRQKKIIDLAMTKCLWINSAITLSRALHKRILSGEKAKAQDLLNKLTAKYKDNLNYYSKLKSSEQSSLAVDIITDLERYRSYCK